MASSSGVENYELNQTTQYQNDDLEKKNHVYDDIIEEDDSSYTGSASKFKYGDETAELSSSSKFTSKSPFLMKLVKLMDLAETKGIQPVPEEEKTDSSLYDAGTMWLSANLVVATFALGTLGGLVFGINFGACVLTIIFFSLLGCVPVAFFSTFGAHTGMRQMVLSRFLMGNVCARVFALINCVACVGWGAVNTIASAQLLVEVNSPHNCPPWAAVLIICIGTWFITFFGYKVIHFYEKWSWVPTFAVFLVIIACLRKKDTFENGPWGGGPTTAGGVLSFGSTIFGFAIGWVSYISDYTAYMPRSTNKIALFFSILCGSMIPLCFVLILGAAAAATTLVTPQYMTAYTDRGVGGMLYAIMVEDSLHGFGQFCCVVLAMSTVANNVPNMYSIAFGAQSIWSPLKKCPRPLWTTVGTGITIAIGIGAYYKFTSFMSNFMDAISYYLGIYTTMGLSEHFIYNKGRMSSYNPADWDNWHKLPIGIAGCCGLFVGAIGVAVGMDQTYWVGELGRKIGEYGGDIGFELGVGFSFIVFNLLRPFEKKYFGR
ncbi:Purine-cytosine permease fcy2 [Hanseniaspora osmophila]|uniref:Purine-cytosine permease FCY2 n=1 Tax=Hanseniaspora osmophila TaxID=56408 RepID=A0A1E5RAQ4_9ASCO|nr:Purine-cytosine permease FCY2 [Hanseniaspora osmophila]